MYILNKNHFMNKNKDVLRLHKSFSNKQWKPQHLMSMLEFLSNESSIFTLEFAFNNITFVKDQLELEEEVLDFSNIDFSKCGSVRHCISGVNGLYNIYFANIKNVNNIFSSAYDNDGYRFDFIKDLKNNELKSIHVKNCNLTGDNDTNYSILFLPRFCYSKDIVIENSTIKYCNLYNSSHTLNIERVLVKDSKLYINSYYGGLCGEFTDKGESIEFINSTVIPYQFDCIFRSKSQKIKEISLPNIKNEGNIKITSTGGGFGQSQYLESIHFNDFDTLELTNMSNLFLNCQSLLEVTGLENKNFSKVTTIANMFKECNKLNEIPNMFNTMTEVTDLSGLFHSCRSIREIKLEMNIPKCNMSAMIYQNDSLEKVDLSKVVIYSNNGTVDKINFTENLKYCPKLKEIHLGLMKCGVIFQVQPLDGSPNIKRVFIPKETNMGIAVVDGWYYDYDNVGIFKNCAKDCIIYTDANYSFSYETQQATGTKPANWLDKFNNHYGDGGSIKGLTIIGNTPSDQFFQQVQITDSGNLHSYVVRYRQLDTSIEQIISGKSILKCYISQDQNLTFDNVKTAIQQNQVTEVPYTDVLRGYYQGSGKLNIRFKIQEYVEKYKPKMIILDVQDVDTNTKTINAFYMQQIGVDDPSFDINQIPTIEQPTDNDFQDIFNNSENDSNGVGGSGSGGVFNSGNGGNAGVPNYGNDPTGNTQVTNDNFANSGPKITESNGDIFITDGRNKIKITPETYERILIWLNNTNHNTKDFYGRNLLIQAMFSTAKYALAGHDLQDKIGYYLYKSYKMNNFALSFIGGNPAILYKENGTNNDEINTDLAQKSYQLYTSLLAKWKAYYNKTDLDFKTLYEQSKFSFFEVDYSQTLPKITRTENRTLFPKWTWIQGVRYTCFKSIAIYELNNQGIDAWYL